MAFASECCPRMDLVDSVLRDDFLVTQQQTIQLNGQPHDISKDCSIADLLVQLKNNNRAIAIEINGEIVSAADFANRKIADGDSVEIVSFVGGG